MAYFSRHFLKRGFVIVGIISLCLLAYTIINYRTQAPQARFTLLSGQRLSTEALKDKVYLVHFWATSCTTCMQEMPAMIELYKKYKDRPFDFLAIAMQYDPPMYVMNYARTQQLPFKVIMDSDGRLAHQYGDIQLTPTTLLVDKKGNILKRYTGIPEFKELNKLIEKALS